VEDVEIALRETQIQSGSVRHREINEFVNFIIADEYGKHIKVV